MQIPLRVRQGLTGGITLDTDAVDVQGIPLLVLVLTVYTLTGTTPSLTAQLFTSDDLQIWDPITGTVSVAAANTSDRQQFQVINAQYGRYVRVQLVLAGGASATTSYSLWLNTYTSS